MTDILTCPNCHQPINPTDYFCPNCGKKIRTPPPSTTLSSQILLYIKTLLLPPFGLYWGFRYLRQPDQKSKLIGLVVIVITIIETIFLIQYTINTINTVNQQIIQQSELFNIY